jgi:AraC-type DNA-binding domain-containing proteins
MSAPLYESVLKAIDFIEDNLQNDIGVSDVAAHVSYSQFYFSREFSRLTHISVYDYITRRRITESCKCLFKNRNVKIVDLAFAYGFKSHEGFTRAFRKVFGENPSDLKELKPLALFDPIDKDYLSFLCELSVELRNDLILGQLFEPDFKEGRTSHNDFLAILDKSSLMSFERIIYGFEGRADSGILSFPLGTLRHKVRIESTDMQLSLRYFTDFLYDREELGVNFILVRRYKHFTDIFVPVKVC